MNSKAGKLEWFGGNQDALNVYRMLVDLSHVWDDLVDKDTDVPEIELNNAFLIALVYLPANPFYRSIQDQIFDVVNGRCCLRSCKQVSTGERPAWRRDSAHAALLCW